MLPVVEWMAQQDLTECSKVVDKKYVHMLDVNLQRLQTFLEIKEQSVQHQERIRSAVNSDMRWRRLLTNPMPSLITSTLLKSCQPEVFLRQETI